MPLAGRFGSTVGAVPCDVDDASTTLAALGAPTSGVESASDAATAPASRATTAPSASPPPSAASFPLDRALSARTQPAPASSTASPAGAPVASPAAPPALGDDQADDQEEVDALAPWAIARCLQPLSSLPDDVWLQGDYAPDATARPSHNGPLLAGRLTLSENAVVVGSCIIRRGWSRPWRVLNVLADGALRVVSVSGHPPLVVPRLPRRDVITQLRQSLRVFDCAGAAVPAQPARGPPVGPTMLVFDPRARRVRRLLASEHSAARGLAATVEGHEPTANRSEVTSTRRGKRHAGVACDYRSRRADEADGVERRAKPSNVEADVTAGRGQRPSGRVCGCRAWPSADADGVEEPSDGPEAKSIRGATTTSPRSSEARSTTTHRDQRPEDEARDCRARRSDACQRLPSLALSASVAVLALVLVGLSARGAPAVLMPAAADAVVGVPLDHAPRADIIDFASRWLASASDALGDVRRRCFQAGDIRTDQGRLVVVVGGVCDLGRLGSVHLAARLGLGVVELDRLTASPTYQAASLALAAVRSFGPASDALDLRHAAGASAAASLAWQPAQVSAEDLALWWPEFALDLEHQALVALRSALRAADGPDAAYYSGWADQLAPASHSSIPSAVVRESRCAFQHFLVHQPFRDRYDYARALTAPLPRPPPQPPPPPNFCPKSLADLVQPQALRRLYNWLRRSADDLRALKKGKPYQRRAREPLIITQAEVHAPARGLIWDLRSTNALGCFEPLDISAPPLPHFNLDALEAALHDYPDRELLSHLRHGVDFKVDLGLTFVLFPHLTSLEAGFAGIDTEVTKHASAGRFDIHASVPFFPMRCHGRGSAARKLEPDRPRPTTDGGQPRQPIPSPAGGFYDITSLNHAITLGGALPKEVKPRTEDKMHNDAILLHAARFVFADPVYQFVDDAKNFFMQFPLAPKEYPWSNFVWLGANGRAVFVHEKVLGFGVAASSNIAQRFAWALMFVLHRRFDAEEAGFWDSLAANSIQGQWRDARRHLSGPHPLRLYSAWMYTDDMCATVVGVDRALRLLRLWRTLTLEFGLDMAQPAKRAIGCDLTWLGVRHNSVLGAAIIPLDKRLRALSAATNLSSGVATTVSEHQAVCGLLEHLRPILALPHEVMHFFYAAARSTGTHKGALLHPGQLIIVTPELQRQATRWVSALQERSAVVCSSVFHAERPAASSTAFALYSDAAKEASSDVGLGGYFHGSWWSLSLRDAGLLQLDLSIPVLEMLAVALNFLTAFPLIQGSSVALYSDSLTATDVLQRDSAKSTLMQVLTSQLYATDEFRSAAKFITVSHCYGEGNPLADAASRGKARELMATCSALGIHPRRLGLSTSAQRFLASFVESARRLTATERGLSPAFSSNDAGDGPWPLSSAPAAAQILPPLPSPRSSRSRRSALHLRPVPFPPQHLLPQVSRRSALRALRAHGSPPPLPVPPPPLRPVVTQPLRRLSASFDHEPLSRRRRLDPPPRLQVDGIADLLLRDRSPYALRPPGGADELRDLCRFMDDVMQEAVPQSTQRANDSALRSYYAACDRIGARPFRDDHAANSGLDPLGHQREVAFLCLVFLDVFLHMQPRKKADRDAGRPAQPSSAMKVIDAIRRIHRAAGITMAKPPQLSLLCQGLYHQIKRRFGHEYIRVDRKNPFPDSVIAAAFSLPDGTICLSNLPGARFEVRWSDPTFVAFRAANALARYCGVRKDEVALADGSAFDLGRTSRANLLWRIRGVDVASPTAAQLRSLASDDLAIFVPATAKNDQFGFHFSSTPVWIKHTADPLDARDALAAYELCQPLSGPSRRYSPLFCVAPFQPLRQSTVDRLLQGLLSHVVGVDSVAQYSFHSHRITIASKLRKAGFDWPTIQALVRWRSVESALIYARLTPAGHASALATALSVDATSVTAEQLPTIDASEIAAALHAAQSLATANTIPGDGDGDGHAN